MAKLYIVPTPIGNLDDITLRAVNVLREVDFILAEDTRTTSFLLKHLGIEQKLRSHHKFNEHATVEMVAGAIAAGRNAALVSDAGTPAISDPGEDLVRLCGQQDITVQAIPGCCAAVCALAVSGLPTGRFCFEGFLSANKKERRTRLEELSHEERTMVFHEAPHKLRPTLADMLEVLGDRPVALCRELTKLHEEIWKTTLGEAQTHYAENDPRGEYVLVMAGAPAAEAEEELTLEQAAQRALELTRNGYAASAAAKAAAQGTPYSKSEVYKQLLALQAD